MGINSEVNLGDVVKDKVSGLKGIAVARCSYLNGCDHIGIQSPAKDGKIPPIQWVDLPQVAAVIKRKTPKKSDGVRLMLRGGPAQHPGGRRPPSEHDD